MADKKNKSKVKPIDFRSDTFGYLLDDMTTNFNKLLKDMERHGSDEGSFTVKINVALEDKELDDGKQHTVPDIKHKIKSGFQVTNEVDGSLDGDYVLQEGENGTYQLSLLTEQLDMLGEDA